MVKLGEIARIIESGKKKEPPKPKSLGAAAPGEIDKDKARFLAPFSFPMEVTKEYMEKSNDPEKARKKVENLEKIINKELSELRKKGKDIISDGYAYDYLESNRNSPLANMLCDYWEEQKAGRTEEKKGIEEGNKPVASQSSPEAGMEESVTVAEKEIPPAEKPKFTEEENSKFLEDFNGRFEKGILEKIEKEDEKTEREKELKEIDYAIDYIRTAKKSRINRIEKGDLTENESRDVSGLLIKLGGQRDIDDESTIFDLSKLSSREKDLVYAEKTKANDEIEKKWKEHKTARGAKDEIKSSEEAKKTEEKQEIKKEGVIKKSGETRGVGEKGEISEKKRVIKEITEEKLEERLRNVKTKEELLDILNSYESFQFNPSEKKKGEYYWLINSPHFDELRKYLKGEINKLDDGYWRDIPLVIQNKVRDMFAAEKKQRDSKEKIESGKEKSAEEQLFEQDMKTLKDIALRMTLELDSRLKEEDAAYKNKNEKDRNAFLQGALRSFLQKVMKRYELPPEESKGKISQIIEGIINS